MYENTRFKYTLEHTDLVGAVLRKCVLSQLRISLGRQTRSRGGWFPPKYFCAPQIALCPEKFVLNMY